MRSSLIKTTLLGLGLLISNGVMAATVAPVLITKRNFKTYDIKPSEVSFEGTGYHEILSDSGWPATIPFAKPHWKDNSSPANGTATDPEDVRFPISYTAGSKVSVSAKLLIAPVPPAGTDIRVRALGPGFDMPAQAVTVSNGKLQYPLSEAATPLPAGTRQFNSLVLTWQVSVDGGNNWRTVGQTGNRAYITLANPLASAKPYQTAMNFATNGSATTASQAAAMTWAQFAGPANIQTWDGRSLFYYKPNQGFTSCATSSGELLASPTGSGQCGSFAYLLMDALGMNGIGSTFVIIGATTGENFLVKNWLYSSTQTFSSQTPTHPWRMVLSEGGGGMVPPLANNIYGDLTSQTGIPGQNTATPSEKVFGSHFIVLQGTGFYDPSYGVTYTGASDFQSKAVTGFSKHFNGDANDVWHVRQPSASTDIGFFAGITYE